MEDYKEFNKRKVEAWNIYMKENIDIFALEIIKSIENGEYTWRLSDKFLLSEFIDDVSY